MAASSLEAISRSGLEPGDIDFVVPHQANQRIIEATARRLKMPMDRVVMNIARYGNTSAASIPIALHEAWEHRQVTPGQHLLLTAFGAGLAWGSLVLDWTLEPPAQPSPEEPTTSGLPILRGLLDGSLWDGETIAPPLPAGTSRPGAGASRLGAGAAPTTAGATESPAGATPP
jgi:3-Oxoacyl-[acyl-carrier-protein (ACP)] synthase III C terminal